MDIPRNPTRAVRIGSVAVGGGRPIVVQSMTTTKTADAAATARQAETLREAGAGVVRVAVDSRKDAEALGEVRRRTTANLAVDLQENYPLAAAVAPHVDKIRYNPGHLYHLEKGKTVPEKVRGIVESARRHGCAVRIGVNCGSVDPGYASRFSDDPIEAMVRSAEDHCRIVDDLGFSDYVVSLKDSDPAKVVEANRRFSARRPDVPLHLGVTEAGLPPDGILKSRLAFEKLLAEGIGDTIRVSLTLPTERKAEEVRAGLRILEDVAAGRFANVPDFQNGRLNIVSCPSCSRVENEAFVELAERVRALAAFAREHSITIAVMGCRVNGPGETDDADLGLWCGPTTVNLKRKSETIGSFRYDEVLGRLKSELDALIASRAGAR